jgi:DNA polymerase-3 subunit delta
MPEVSYQDLDRTLQDLEKLRSWGVFLIWGQEALCSRALGKIAGMLLPGGRRNPAFEVLEGTDVNVPSAIERVGTYSLLSEGRIVLLSDSSLFHARQDHGELLAKAAAAFADNRLKQAASWLLKLLAVENLGLDDVSVKTIRRLKGIEGSEEELAWVLDLVDYCRGQGLEVPADVDAAGVLKGTVERGFPKGNYLIITCGKVRKTISFYRTVKKQGLIIDCSVPGGSRAADKRARSGLLRQEAGVILAKSGKRVAPDALAAVEEMTGFDPRTFAHNLEKLVSYVGNRERITRDDVNRVLSRSRSDPIYEFTGAVINRRVDDALFYLKSLLADGAHPLQLLTAMVNQLRRMILIKGFTSSREGSCWKAGMSFNQFKAAVLPAVKAHDDALKEVMASWKLETVAAGRQKSKKKKVGSSDLMLLGKGASPYALYMRFRESEAFSMQELLRLLQNLRKADAGLKTSAQPPALLLEATVVSICGLPDSGSKR